MSPINRVPAGVPSGGEFAETRKAEATQAQLQPNPDPRAERTADDVTLDPTTRAAYVTDAYGRPLQLVYEDWHRTGPDGDDKECTVYDTFTDEDFHPELSPFARRALSDANARIAAQPLPDGTTLQAARVLLADRAPAQLRSQALADLGDPVESFDAGIDVDDLEEARTVLRAHGLHAADASSINQLERFDQLHKRLAETGRLDPAETEELISICRRGQRLGPSINHHFHHFDRQKLAAFCNADPADARLLALESLSARSRQIKQLRHDFDALADNADDDEISDEHAERTVELLGRDEVIQTYDDASWLLQQQSRETDTQLRAGIAEVLTDPRPAHPRTPQR